MGGRTGRPFPPAIDRLWGFIGDRHEVDECWPWLGSLQRTGYGRGIRINGPQIQAHRASYMLLVGPIPDGLQIDHLCRNPRCVNPAHLEPVTPGENVRRRPTCTKTKCKHGHDFTPENTYNRSDGRRMCRKCVAATERRRAAKLKLRRAEAK